MTDLSLHAVEIRQFLLGQLQEVRAERLEERIFADPDFAEEVDIVESELIDDYLADKLGLQDRKQFEQRYLKSAPGLETVAYEDAFAEFIRNRPRGAEPLHGGEPGQVATAPAEAGVNLQSSPPDGPGPEGWFHRLRHLVTANPAPARLTVAAVLLLLLAVGLWYLSPWYLPRPGKDDSASAEQRALEAELARLNADDAAAVQVEERVTVDLMPMRRGGGSVPRLPFSDLNQGGNVKLRLRLGQTGPTRYRAVFLDDRRNRLFAVSNLTARNAPDGPQIWLLVPSRYFKPGDYQISLSAVNNEGGDEEVNSYALRVVETK